VDKLRPVVLSAVERDLQVVQTNAGTAETGATEVDGGPPITGFLVARAGKVICGLIFVGECREHYSNSRRRLGVAVAHRGERIPRGFQRFLHANLENLMLTKGERKESKGPGDSDERAQKGRKTW
jgi:hypothetical protein